MARPVRKWLRAALVLPEPGEAPARELGVADRMLDIAMAEIVLNRPRVPMIVRELVAACMPQHVRMHLHAKMRRLAQALDQAREAGPR